jgi:hypothetical protein
MLRFVNLANEAIQAKGIKLSDAQMHLDNLIEQIEAGNKNRLAVKVIGPVAVNLVDLHWQEQRQIGQQRLS